MATPTPFFTSAPNRVYDNFDVLSNAVAALIGIVGSVVIGWVNAVLDRRGGART